MKTRTILVAILASLQPYAAWASEDEAELAKKLTNPVASLISVPIQANWDFHIGPNDATRFTLNVQPVIPLSLNDETNLIIRTILPVIDAASPAPGIPSASGFGDIVQSFFFSPKAPTSGGWMWGAGPVFLWPTATNDLLGSGKWGAGPTAVLLKQSNGWTYGILANQLLSYASTGGSNRTKVNATFIQPFLSYTTKTYTTFGINTESTYDWEGHQWNVPLNLTVGQLFKIGGQPMQFTLGARYYAENANGGPGWGARAALTFLFPK